MSALLSHVLPSLAGVAKEHLAGMLTHWPHTDREEATQWWPLVLKSNSPEAMAVFHARFDPQFWVTPVGEGSLPFAQAMTYARKALSKSVWEGAHAAEVVSWIAEHTPDATWEDPTVKVRQQHWLLKALPVEQAHEALEHLVEVTLTRAQFDVNAPVEGIWMGSLLRQPRAVRAWVAAGGNLHQTGWDARQPERMGWEVLAHQYPLLREALAEKIPELQQQRQDLERQDCYWRQLLSEKKTADERWKALLSEPDWATFRSPQGQMHPLWCALQRTPAILPKLIQAVRQDSQWQEHLQVRDTQGAGLWESLVRVADSRSVTPEVLDQLSRWVPPRLERSVLLQGLRNELQPDRERRGGLVIHMRKTSPRYPGSYTFEVAKSVARHLGNGWLGQGEDQVEIVRLIQAHPQLASKALLAVVEHELAEGLIPELRTLLLHQALTKATEALPKASLRQPHERVYSREILALGLDEVCLTPDLATAICTYREAFDTVLAKAHESVSHATTLKVQAHFMTLERHAVLNARPAPSPSRPRRRA